MKVIGKKSVSVNSYTKHLSHYLNKFTNIRAKKRPIPSVYSSDLVIPIQTLIQPIISQVQFCSSFFSFLNEWEEAAHLPYGVMGIVNGGEKSRRKEWGNLAPSLFRQFNTTTVFDNLFQWKLLPIRVPFSILCWPPAAHSLHIMA